MMQHRRDFGVYLLGPPAAGKGMLGNLIIEKPVFLSTSVTQGAAAADNLIYYTVRQSRKIAVAEGPDIGTPQQRANNSRAFVRSVGRFIDTMNQPQRYMYFEFILVLRFGERVPEDLRSMVLFLEAVLGTDLLVNHTRIVMSGGDIFEREHGNNRPETFLNWCRGQPESFLRQLMLRFQWRVNLFGDKRKDEKGLQNQVQQFIDSIDNQRPENRVDQSLQFRQAKGSRIRAIVSSRSNHVEQNTKDQLETILRRLNQIQSRLLPVEQLPRLEGLRSDIELLFQEVQAEDSGTSLLEQTLTHVKLANRSVNDAIVVCRNFIQSDHRSSVAEDHILQLYRRQTLIIMVVIVLVGIVFLQNFRLPCENSSSDSSRNAFSFALVVGALTLWFYGASLSTQICFLLVVILGCYVWFTFGLNS